MECHVQGQLLERVIIKEINSFQGIPYSDYFHVIIEWDVKAIQPTTSTTTMDTKKKVQVTVSLDFKFFKSTWLQGTIESNTKAELMEVYELWINAANEFLQHDVDIHQNFPDNDHSLYEKQSLSLQDPSKASKHVERDYTTDALSPKALINAGTRTSLASSSRDSLGSNASNSNNINKRRSHQSSQQASYQQEQDYYGTPENEAYISGEEEEELLFYDCEQGDQTPIYEDSSSLYFSPNRPTATSNTATNNSGSNAALRSSSSSALTASQALYQRVVPPPTPPDLRRLYPARSLDSLNGSSTATTSGSQPRHYDHHKNSFDDSEYLNDTDTLESGENHDFEDNKRDATTSSAALNEEQLRNSSAARKKRYQSQLRQYRHGSTRDMAIQVVETVFVLLEFSFWQVQFRK